MAKNNAKPHKMTHPTVDWDHKTGALKTVAELKQYNVPYAEAKPKGKQFGMRITVHAFHQLLQNALQTNAEQKQPGLRFVEFSKASLFRVLSQPGCEYIRFYFVYPEKDRMSLVLEGLDADQQALKLESHVLKMATGSKGRRADADDPAYEEIGNGSEAGAASSFSATAATPRSAAAKKKAVTAGQASLAALLKAINTRSDK